VTSPSLFARSWRGPRAAALFPVTKVSGQCRATARGKAGATRNEHGRHRIGKGGVVPVRHLEELSTRASAHSPEALPIVIRCWYPSRKRSVELVERLETRTSVYLRRLRTSLRRPWTRRRDLVHVAGLGESGVQENASTVKKNLVTRHRGTRA